MTPAGAQPEFCTGCGRETGGHDHAACRRAATLDPPRYCPRCGRRMVVKVTPSQWTAECSRHGPPAPAPASP